MDAQRKADEAAAAAEAEQKWLEVIIIAVGVFVLRLDVAVLPCADPHNNAVVVRRK